jgi:hypothetical protein
MSDTEVKLVRIQYPSILAGSPAYQRLVAREEARRAQLTPLDRAMEDIIAEALEREILGVP